jgi:hypothetical protein
LIFLFPVFLFSNAQSDSCKVLLKSIADDYDGKCKAGLAHGKGTARGEDTYTGHFKNGLPDGKGTYTYKNGDIYKGYWKEGLKEGNGKFTLTRGETTIVQTGYWKGDEYVGKTDPEKLYHVRSSQGILNYTVNQIKSDSDADRSVIIFIRSAMINYIPPDLQIGNSSGKLMISGKRSTISDYFCPLIVEVSYSIEMAAGDRKICNFSIEILEEGRYEILISNDL